MKAISLTRFTSGWIASLSLLVLAGCGSDSNPINPTAARTNVNQVTSANSTVPNNVFSATLTGAEQVPSVSTAATGTGLVVVDPTTRQMKATIVTADINATAAHIHVAPRGVAGTVAFTLTQTSTGSGIWTASTILSEEQLNLLRAGSYYFNVHTAAFPDGEIRGQILVQLPKSGSAIPANGTLTASGSSGTSGSAGSSGTSGVTNTGTGAVSTTSTATTGNVATGTSIAATRPLFFTNVLSGSLAVPPTSSAATATSITVYRARDRVLTSVIVSSGINATGANLRQAVAGAIGPVVNSLRETTPGAGIWTASTTLSASQGTALTSGNMYYELISAAFPDGELRGQIVRTSGTTRAAATGTAASTVTPMTTTPSTTTPPTATPSGTTMGTTAPVTETGTTAGTPGTPATTTPTTGITTPATTTTTVPTTAVPTTNTGATAGTTLPTTTTTPTTTGATTGTTTGTVTPLTASTTGSTTGSTNGTATVTATDAGTTTTTPPTITTGTSSGMSGTGTTGTGTASSGTPLRSTTAPTTTVTPITTLTGVGSTTPSTTMSGS